MSDENEKTSAPFDERGVALSSLRVDLLSDADLWEALRKLGATVEEEEVGDNATWEAKFWALPQEGHLYLAARVHPHSKEAQKAHWILELIEKPESAPPADILKSSERTGGYPECVRRLDELLPPQIRDSVEVKWVSAWFIVDRNRWGAHLSDGPKLSSVTLPNGRKAVQKMQSWSFEDDEAGSLRLLSLILGKQDFYVAAEAKPVIAFTPAVLTEAEATVWKEVEGCLPKKS